MKKSLLTLAFVAMATVSSFAQGTINPLNGPLAGTKVWVDVNNDGVKDRLAEAADGITFSIFFGAAGSDAATLAQGGTMTISTTSPGVLAGLPTLFALSGAGEGGTVVSLKIVAGGNGRGDTGVKQVTLAPAAGPGTGLWSSTASTAKFLPLTVTLVPEPSTIALGVLGLGSLLLFRRRK